MKLSYVELIQDRHTQVMDKIEKAATSSGRDPKNIKVVVVTKAHSVEIAEAVLTTGTWRLGENYVEEAIPKIKALSHRQVEWHMIGHIQSRKAKLICENFSFVHSLDRLKVAQRLDRYMAGSGRRLPVLMECNVSGEESKFGFPAWNLNLWDELVEEVGCILELQNIEVRGLMTMPPWNPDPGFSRPYFQKLRKLRDLFMKNFPNAHWDELSMGMSDDFEVAIQEGATFVRIGTAIVGPRE